MKIEEFLKLKVGDKVKIVDKRPETDAWPYFVNSMNKWLGKVMTIRRLDDFDPDYQYVCMVEDKDEDFGCGWYWGAHMIERKIEEKKPDILRVRCVESKDPDFTAGKVYERINGVMVDDRGHEFRNLCRADDLKDWAFTAVKFELADSKERYPQIVIKQDGNTVTAYCGSAKGVAKCSPEDTFDLYTGAQLALARAFGREEKKDEESLYPKIDWDGLGKAITKGFEEATKNMYKLADDIERASKKEEPKKPKNLKVKCVANDYATKRWTVGKVYERIDGYLTDNFGDKWYNCVRSDDPKEWRFIGWKFELYEDPKKPKNLKVKCVHAPKDGTLFIEGKVYERVNGRLRDEYNWGFTNLCESDDPTEWGLAPEYKFELYEEPKKIRVKCTYAEGGCFEEGKIYEWVDDALTAEDGYTFRSTCRGSDPSKWSFVHYKFELVDVLKVRCVESHLRIFTKGKVYERINGVLTDDYGYKWKTLCRNDDPKYWGFIHHKFELAE